MMSKPEGRRYSGTSRAGVLISGSAAWRRRDLTRVRNLGTCRSDAKGEVQVGSPHEDERTEAGHRGGAVRSRDEGSVMGLDRRGCVVRPCGWGQPAMGGAPAVG